jgi:hypothetical protein
MSVGFCPVYDKSVPDAKFEADGRVLLEECSSLDDLANKLGLSPLSSFADRRPIPEGFDGEPWELDEILGEWKEWFSAADGLRTAARLIAAITAQPDFRGQHYSREEIISELEELMTSLRSSLEHDVRFRLEVF